MKSDDKKLLRAKKRYVVGIIKAIRDNTAALLALKDGEHLHDLRVAIRRLQAINELFEATIKYVFDEGFKTSLKTVMSASSKLRDIEEFELFTKQKHTDEQKEKLKNIVLGLLSDSLLWHKALNEYLKLFAKAQIDVGFRKKALEITISAVKGTSKKYGKLMSATDYDFDKLHKVRKRCKRYRYQLDFIFADSNEGSMICKQMQEKLGVVNDVRIWLEMADAAGFDDSLKSGLRERLSEAIHDMRVDGNVFASAKYRGYLFDALRKRLSML